MGEQVIEADRRCPLGRREGSLRRTVFACLCFVRRRIERSRIRTGIKVGLLQPIGQPYRHTDNHQRRVCGARGWKH
jgi:hypothetical protein